jgi:nuclear transcription factor Y gamma
LTSYWQNTIADLEHEQHDYKIHQLPLARIKKVMKADPEVKMISAEAPILFAKGCDIFITELTMRAWIHAEENKRRTLQRSDIASALTKSDMFDFLIDIVPREEANHSKRTAGQSAAGPSVGGMPGNAAGLGQHATSAEFTLGQHGMPPDQEAAFRYNQGVQPGPGGPYGVQSQMYGKMEAYPEMEGLYPNYAMQPSQVRLLIILILANHAFRYIKLHKEVIWVILRSKSLYQGQPTHMHGTTPERGMLMLKVTEIMRSAKFCTAHL